MGQTVWQTVIDRCFVTY